MKINYLVIEGNIGAGKTSLATMLAKEFHAKEVLEGFNENPFLPKFYEDRDKYAFPLEMSFLADRYSQLNKNIREFELFSSFVISDYYFMKSLIFAQNTLSETEYQLYQRFFNIIYEKLPKPDLYVYLHLDVDNLLKNIEKRGRSYEQKMDPLYLEKISQGYFSFFNQQNNFPILILDTNKIDFVRNKEHYKRIAQLIFERDYPKGINRVLMD
ncbi:deoxynucleoside kinase [Sunxiuqinia sp. A32]|uniref:deoxynucleoside kinase n=1 Tax=Sunxiuqinia sp. A32 TaxID=3461496 RepID=UPI00404685A2